MDNGSRAPREGFTALSWAAVTKQSRKSRSGVTALQLKPAVAGFLVFAAVSCFGETPDALTEAASPRWEVGLGFASQVLPDYRGSYRYGVEGLALPYFFYRGKIFKVDQKGARGELLNTPRWRFNVSLDSTLSVGDERNEERRGMPELNSSIEIGPSLEVLLGGKSFYEGWSLRLPIRAVFAVEPGEIEPIGYVMNPRLTWRTSISETWRFSLNTGVLYASAENHAYFYQVNSTEALPDRPAYQASGGYSGFTNRVALYRQNGPWRFAVALRYDNLRGTAFDDSPLVVTPHYTAVTLGIARRLWSSGY